MSIVNGKTESHLDMLDNMVIERLLNDKWSSFARVIKSQRKKQQRNQIFSIFQSLGNLEVRC